VEESHHPGYWDQLVEVGGVNARRTIRKEEVKESDHHVDHHPMPTMMTMMSPVAY